MVAVALAAGLVGAGAVGASASPDTWLDHAPDDPEFTLAGVEFGWGGKPGTYSFRAGGRGVPGAKVYPRDLTDEEAAAGLSGATIVRDDGYWSTRYWYLGGVPPQWNAYEYTQVLDGKIIGRAAEYMASEGTTDSGTSAGHDGAFGNARFTASITSVAVQEDGRLAVTLTGTRDNGTAVVVRDSEGNQLAGEPLRDKPVQKSAEWDPQWTLTVHDLDPGQTTLAVRQLAYYGSGTKDNPYDVTGIRLQVDALPTPIVSDTAGAATGLGVTVAAGLALAITWVRRQRQHP